MRRRSDGIPDVCYITSYRLPLLTKKKKKPNTRRRRRRRRRRRNAYYRGTILCGSSMVEAVVEGNGAHNREMYSS